MSKQPSTGPTLSPVIALLRSRFTTDENAATAIEYALIASGIGAAVAATVWTLGTTTKSLYSSIAAIF
jgi:pilus assembly protein Flp/PilA